MGPPLYGYVPSTPAPSNLFSTATSQPARTRRPKRWRSGARRECDTPDWMLSIPHRYIASGTAKSKAAGTGRRVNVGGGGQRAGEQGTRRPWCHRTRKGARPVPTSGERLRDGQHGPAGARRAFHPEWPALPTWSPADRAGSLRRGARALLHASRRVQGGVIPHRGLGGYDCPRPAGSVNGSRPPSRLVHPMMVCPRLHASTTPPSVICAHQLLINLVGC